VLEGVPPLLDRVYDTYEVGGGGGIALGLGLQLGVVLCVFMKPRE